MMGTETLGGLEQAVLLGILAEGPHAFALEVRQRIEQSADQKVSRGAFYTTLERLKRKGFVEWEQAQPEASRRTGTQRRFRVTPGGMEALRSTKAELRNRWFELEQALEEV